VRRPLRIPVLTGPTASGKSALALRLAARLPLEIISADAMMVYREMDIGTAKPSLEERRRVPHHLIDVVAPDEPFDVATFVARAEAAIDEVIARGALPLVVGGTGFYIRALSEGLPTVPPVDPAAQRPLWERFAREGLAGLEGELAARSPRDALRAQRNPRRVVRALEIWRRTGRSPADFPLRPPRFAYRKWVLLPAPAALAGAIERRTEAMFRAGLVAEVERLLARYPAATTALQAIGYKEVRAYLEGHASLEEARQEVMGATLRYAKRQRTWFRKEPGAHLKEIGGAGEESLLAELEAWLREDGV
jgi:tRNA dimethylallyltransferase